MVLPLSRLILLLLLSVLGHGDVLQSSTPESYTFTTDQPYLEDTSALTVSPTTVGTTDAETNTILFVSSMSSSTMTSLPADTSETTEEPTTLQSSTTTEASSPITVLSTTATPEITNTTTSVLTNATPEPTNATILPTTASSTNVTPSVHNITAPTSAPSTLPPIPNPSVGNYTIKPDHNSSVCLIAKMGLQFSFKDGSTFQTVNLDPNTTTASGTCSNVSSSTLLLTSDKITVQFVFVNQQSKFHLSGLDLTVNPETGKPFHVQSTNLSLWEASLGSSYMCQKEQSYNITEDLLLNTFELRVQPFNVVDNEFSTAEDCKADGSGNYVVPLVIGIALIALVLVVVLSYFIGQFKSRATDYEQFS